MNPNSREVLQALQVVGRNNIDAFASCDTEFLRTQATPVFASIRKLQAGTRFIRIMEERKGERQGLSAAEERECLQRANEMAHEVRNVIGRAWRVVQHLETAGTLERLFSATHELVFHRGSIRTAEIWETVLGADGVAEYLKENGLHRESIAEFAEALRSHDRLFKIVDGALVAEPPDSEVPGQSDQISRPPARRIKVKRHRRPVTATTLWEEDLLSAAISTMEQPGILGIEVFRDSDFGDAWACPEELDLVDLLVANGALAVQQLESSVGLIAHSGLPIHRGADPWFWIVVGIVAAAAFLASITIVIVCAASDDFKKGHSTLCDVSSWLSIVGLFLLMGSACAEGANCKVVISVQGKGSSLLATEPTMGPLA